MELESGQSRSQLGSDKEGIQQDQVETAEKQDEIASDAMSRTQKEETQEVGLRKVLVHKRSQVQVGLPYSGGSNFNSSQTANKLNSQQSLRSGGKDVKRVPSVDKLSLEDDITSESSVSAPSKEDDEEQVRIDKSESAAQVTVLKSEAYNERK